MSDSRNATQATGELIRRKRLELGWTQEALAEKLDTSSASINRYENGRRKITLELLYEFAAVFGVPPADLMVDADGLSEDERELINWMRDHPRDEAVLRSTYRGLKQASDFQLESENG